MTEEKLYTFQGMIDSLKIVMEMSPAENVPTAKVEYLTVRPAPGDGAVNGQVIAEAKSSLQQHAKNIAAATKELLGLISDGDIEYNAGARLLDGYEDALYGQQDDVPLDQEILDAKVKRLYQRLASTIEQLEDPVGKVDMVITWLTAFRRWLGVVAEEDAPDEGQDEPEGKEPDAVRGEVEAHRAESDSDLKGLIDLWASHKNAMSGLREIAFLVREGKKMHRGKRHGLMSSEVGEEPATAEQKGKATVDGLVAFEGNYDVNPVA